MRAPVPLARVPELLPQDMSLWPSAAVELALSVPERERWRLRSPDPGMREMLAADESCSEAAMCLLVGDVEPVQLALASNQNLLPRAGDMLLVSAMAACWGVRRGDRVLRALVGNPASGVDMRAAQRHGARSFYPYPAGRFLSDPSCEVELLRVLWRVGELRPHVGEHPNLPDDLVLQAAIVSPRRGGTAIRCAVKRRGWDGGNLDWQHVRRFARRLNERQRERLFDVLPDRFLAAATVDGEPEIRAAAASAIMDVETLGQLACDPDPAVRRRASGRLLQLIAGVPG